MKLAELEKRLKTEPDNLGLRIMVAGALREAGRQAEAVELYRSVAIAYRDQGRTQQAIACCRSILEIAPDDQRCLALLAALVAGHKARLQGGTQTGPQPVAQGSSADQGMPAPEPEVPKRRSSREDHTPLPQALPHHIHDPTTKSLKKLSISDLEHDPPVVPLTTTTSTTDADDEDDLPVAEGAQTRPGSEPGARSSSSVVGLANAARRISASLIGSLDGDYDAMDLAAELDTRQRPRIEPVDIAQLAVPPTVPVERVDPPDPDDAVATGELARLTPSPDAIDDDAITQLPSEPTLERVPIATRDSSSEDEQTRPREMPMGTRPQPVPLLTSAFFRPLPSDRRMAVLNRFQRRSVSAGSTVIRQGETNHALVVVARGKLEVRAERPDKKLVVITTIASGDYIGEAALLARAPASAHVVAATDTELLCLPPRDFYEIAGAYPALWAELKSVAERRTREQAAKLT